MLRKITVSVIMAGLVLFIGLTVNPQPASAYAQIVTAQEMRTDGTGFRVYSPTAGQSFYIKFAGIKAAPKQWCMQYSMKQWWDRYVKGTRVIIWPDYYSGGYWVNNASTGLSWQMAFQANGYSLRIITAGAYAGELWKNQYAAYQMRRGYFCNRWP